MQNEATGVILRTTKDTLTETMRSVLDLPSTQITLDRKQNCTVRPYLSALGNPHTHNPALHEAVRKTQKDADWDRAGAGWVKCWMGQVLGGSMGHELDGSSVG